MKRFSLFSLVLAILTSCAPQISVTITGSRPASGPDQTVVVLGLNDSLPAGVETLGTVSVSNNLLGKTCGYAEVIETAKNEVRKAGGNALKIDEHTAPTYESAIGSSFHQIKGRMLRTEHPEAFVALADSAYGPGNVDYALLVLYCPTGYGIYEDYDVYIDGRYLCGVSKFYKNKYRIYRTGKVQLNTNSGLNANMETTLEAGKTYYLNCRPGERFEFVDCEAGNAEYHAIKKRKSPFPDIIVLKEGGNIPCDIVRREAGRIYFCKLWKGNEIETYLPTDKIERVEYAVNNAIVK